MLRRFGRVALVAAGASVAPASGDVAAATATPFLKAQRLRAASASRARASGLRRRRPPRRPRTAGVGGAGTGVGLAGAPGAPLSRRFNSFSRASICSLIATARRSCSLDKLASAAFMNSVNTVLVRFGKQESEQKASTGQSQPTSKESLHRNSAMPDNNPGPTQTVQSADLPFPCGQKLRCHQPQPKPWGHGANLT